MTLPPLIAGLVGGVISWFVRQFVPEPLRRFFEMRREIVLLLLDCEKVTRPAMIEWPAPGSEDTELGVLMELEVGHGETEVYARVQA
jgi:hypothetical protein